MFSCKPSVVGGMYGMQSHSFNGGYIYASVVVDLLFLAVHGSAKEWLIGMVANLNGIMNGEKSKRYLSITLAKCHKSVCLDNHTD